MNLILLAIERLYINDFNIEADNRKLRGLVDLVTRVNKAIPGTIDAIGIQSHLPVRLPKPIVLFLRR